MTRTRTYALTAVAAALYVLLNWIFADGLFTENWWNSEEITSSAIWTYVLLALIVAAGVVQARRLPAEVVAIRPEREDTPRGHIHDPIGWQVLLSNVLVSIVWLPIRFFVGREWLASGEGKLRESVWMDGGAALQGYWERAVTVPEEGRPAITYDWFRDFLQYMLDHEWYTWFAKLVAIGEVLVGASLIVGALVGIAAFVGTFVNFNFQLAGTASTNPVLFGLSVFLVLAWKVAGYWGLDRWLLPVLGTPWAPGRVFASEVKPTQRLG